MSTKINEQKKVDIYRVSIDGKWNLDDLYKFSQSYSKIYSFALCFNKEIDKVHKNQIYNTLKQSSWNSARSYLNFSKILKKEEFNDYQLKISSIQYASPGWIDLLLHLDVAMDIVDFITSYSDNIIEIVGLIRYLKRIYKTFRKEQKQNGIDLLLLEKEKIKVTTELSDDLAKHLGFNNMKQLNDYTNNPDISIKTLIAHCQRLKVLSDFVQNGKVIFPHKK